MRNLILPLFGCLALVAGCSDDTSAKADVFGVIDAFVEPDGPKPIFRDSGPCIPGASGASGNCNPSGVTPDMGAADMGVPDTTVDQCVPPTQCVVEFAFDKIGSETTASVQGDFDGAGTTWVKKSMTLDSNRWTVSVLMQDGQKLTYKFVVDEGLAGESWFVDASNPNQVDDGFGGKNSVLDVVCPNPCN